MAEDRFEVDDRVRLKENPFSDGTVHRVGWDGAWGQQLMVEVKWDTGGFGGPCVRDLARVEAPSEDPTPYLLGVRSAPSRRRTTRLKHQQIQHELPK